MRRRLWSGWLLLTLLLATACAAAPAPATPTPVAQASPPADPTVRPTGTSTPVPTPSPTATPAPVAPLAIWVAEDEPALETVERLIAAAAYTAGVSVDVFPRAPDTLRLSLASAELTGATLPDLIWADQEALAGLLADGMLQPLEDASVLEGMLPALQTASSAGGQVWGAPVAADGALLLYANPALVAAPPQTSDGLLRTVRDLSRSDRPGLVQFWSQSRWLVPWLYGFGGSLTDASGTRPTLDTPAMVSALGYWRELVGSVPDDTPTYRGGQYLFATGDAALALDGDWALPRFETLSETLRISITSLPRISANNQPAVPLLNGSFVMLHRELDATGYGRAMMLITELQGSTLQRRIGVELRRLPALATALDSPAIMVDPLLAASARMAPDSPGLPPTVAARCALQAIDGWLPDLLDGNVDQEEAAGEIQRTAEACATSATP
jgi:ABC-type glycerol-3-phosphate transport system substrate-binding protein